MAIHSPKFLQSQPERRIAYHKLAGQGDGAKLPGLVFLGGYCSDMTGTKAMWIENWARTRGRAFVRFDYRGHGASSGRFEDCCIGDWLEDAADVLEQTTKGPQILIGSSMGGWIALLLARKMPERIAGMVGIAAAPDFTEDLMWPGLTTAQRQTLTEQGKLSVPTEYDDVPGVITLRLIEEGRNHLVLRTPLHLPFPLRLLHGSADRDVPVDTVLRLLEHVTCDDARLTLVKDADHRFSNSKALALIGKTLHGITSLG